MQHKNVKKVFLNYVLVVQTLLAAAVNNEGTLQSLQSLQSLQTLSFNFSSFIEGLQMEIKISRLSSTETLMTTLMQTTFDSSIVRDVCASKIKVVALKQQTCFHQFGTEGEIIADINKESENINIEGPFKLFEFWVSEDTFGCIEFPFILSYLITTVKPEQTTTSGRLPTAYKGTILRSHFDLLKILLGNDHLSTTAKILESQLWSLYTSLTGLLKP